MSTLKKKVFVVIEVSEEMYGFSVVGVFTKKAKAEEAQAEIEKTVNSWRRSVDIHEAELTEDDVE
jgi:hypothetical protein